MYNDKIISCKDCGAEFVFSAGEQEFYYEKGFMTAPTRCKECRSRIKNEKRHNVVLYEIVCSKCGKIESIPFEPRHDRPVFCGSCYKSQNT